MLNFVDLHLKRPNSVMAYTTIEIQFVCTVQVHIGGAQGAIADTI
jgi:hypothetical protein